MTSEDAGAVFVVDPAAERVLASIEVGPRPRSIAFLPDGSKAYVTNENTPESSHTGLKVVDISNPAAPQVIATIPTTTCR